MKHWLEMYMLAACAFIFVLIVAMITLGWVVAKTTGAVYWWVARRRDARLARHVQAALDARLMRQVEPVTQVMPTLTEPEVRFFADKERQMSPLADFYVFDDEFPPINRAGRYQR